MTTQDPRSAMQDLQRRLSAAESTLIRERAELEAARALLPGSRVTVSVALQELLNYGTAARRMQAEFADLVRMLQNSKDPESKAIGNSMDALFRSTPVPSVLAGR